MIPDFLINLVTITPSSNVEFSNKNILYLKDAHEYLSNDNISEAIKSLEKIQQYEKHFFNWLEQARIYESFIQQMGKV